MPRPTRRVRCAGFAVPLFSLRGVRDVGVGEILDLIPLVRWAAATGQRVVQLLPITETAPGEASPYNALSAFAIDPLYVSVSAVAGAGTVPSFAAEGGPLPRGAIRAAKLQALLPSFVARDSRADEGLRGASSDWLDDYALYRALKGELDDAPWTAWPPALRDRDPAALAEVRRRLSGRIEFLRYVQGLAWSQWQIVRREAERLGVWLKGDLPFVIARDSADVWARQDEFDLHLSAGAPPDAFSDTGQDWDLPMYDWARVRQTKFAWWRQRVRHAAALFDLFRIDHIVGFFRTYAIPHDPTRLRGFLPSDEAGQREQGSAFLQAVLDECRGALPMAEDLGTVPSWVRAQLHGLGIPGYKVFRWERHDSAFLDPRTYDPLSIATTGTHDTETLVEWWRQLSHDERAAALAAVRVAADPHDASLGDDRRWHILQAIYAAGSAFVILPIQDLFGWSDRINVPATTAEANWNWRLPCRVEELADGTAGAETTAAVAAAVRDSGRSAPSGFDSVIEP